MGSFLGSWLRRQLWSLITYLAGGLRVTGTVPEGPGIVVANHTSHADTAIMFAALPARARPFAAAAADYWDSRWYKRWATNALVATVPVHRSEQDAYGELLKAVKPRIEQGGLVVLYPEGTRTQDGRINEFKTGAARLASDLQVPLYPAALIGVREILPKHGKFCRGRMEVAFGDPVIVAEGADKAEVKNVTAELQEQVTELKRNDVPQVLHSRLYDRVLAWVLSWRIFALALLWGVAEALSWPLIAESFLAFFVVLAPRRVIPAAAVLALASAIGVTLHAYLVHNGFTPPMPLTTEAMQAAARAQLHTEGFGALRHQLLSGIPVKVYGHESGLLASPSYSSLFLHTLVWRAARIMGVALIIAVVGRALRPVLQRHYTAAFMGGLVVFALMLLRVYSAWT